MCVRARASACVSPRPYASACVRATQSARVQSIRDSVVQPVGHEALGFFGTKFNSAAPTDRPSPDRPTQQTPSIDSSLFISSSPTFSSTHQLVRSTSTQAAPPPSLRLPKATPKLFLAIRPQNAAFSFQQTTFGDKKWSPLPGDLNSFFSPFFCRPSKTLCWRKVRPIERHDKKNVGRHHRNASRRPKELGRPFLPPFRVFSVHTDARRNPVNPVNRLPRFVSAFFRTDGVGAV